MIGLDGCAAGGWLANQVKRLGINSMLEIGANSGRNLAAVRQISETIKLKGIDVNETAVKFARNKNPSIDFELVDASRWTEKPKSWDAVVTMSFIDHIPDEAIETLADNMVAAAREFIICVEIWQVLTVYWRSDALWRRRHFAIYII
jgi:2-polyprenyl-3-methyl-5-hydroxy-6-metoxy-1,4-benzoquinol methylase